MLCFRARGTFISIIHSLFRSFVLLLLLSVMPIRLILRDVFEHPSDIGSPLPSHGHSIAMPLPCHCHGYSFPCPTMECPSILLIPMMSSPWPLSSCGFHLHGHLWSPMPSRCPFIGNRRERQAWPWLRHLCLNIVAHHTLIPQLSRSSAGSRMGLAEAMPPNPAGSCGPRSSKDVPPGTGQAPRCQWIPLYREGYVLNYGWQLRFRRDDQTIAKWQVLQWPRGKARTLMCAARERLLEPPWWVYWEYSLRKRPSSRVRRRRGVLR